ncbi:MAG: aminotransferase class V-fold PLP-dependent enzyme [Acidimicrobiia bacterium]|nr:aminotransferase class V-fold PLP-dependent enzyme [Acidimicrobiia bacterium]
MNSLVSQSDLFEIPGGVTYLNCAYMSPQLRSVTEAGREGVARKATPWQIGSDDFFSGVETLRERFAALVGGDADGVAVVPSASYGLSLAASNLAPATGGEIVVIEDQFPSNVYPWTDLAARTGGNVVTVTRPDDQDWTAAILDVVGEATSVVAVPPCHWTDGTIVDLRAVSDRTREVGAAFVVDGTQWVGAAAIDVDDLQPDFLVTAAYKWLLGPYSMCLVWVHPRHRQGRPIEFGWVNRDGADDFAGLVDYTDLFRSGARRYDVGETANFVLVPMLTRALDQLLEWGVDRVAATISPLASAVVELAEPLGFVAPPAELRSPHLVGLTLPEGLYPKQLASQMAESSVHVSVRGNVIRVSPHVYNDLGDIDRFAQVLSETVG